MALLALGINHDTATVEVREKVAIAPERMSAALRDFCESVQVEEAIILSTCNRTEILTYSERDCVEASLRWLAHYCGLSDVQLAPVHYAHLGPDAVMHMMRVASGLDSMILGEPQILGQMKSAYAVAREAGTISGPLEHAVQHTFSFAKKVRTQTAIGENPVSVAYAAVHLSQRIFSQLNRSTALLIGAGETIDLVAKHLREKGIKRIIVANRTLIRAQELASQYQAEAILLPDIKDCLPDVDMIISSTASQMPILGKGTIEKALKKRKRKPMFMVDIAVPRDIEPEVAELKDVYLYTVDDLRDIIDENKQARLEEAAKADDILNEGVRLYETGQRVNAVVPTLRAFRQQAEVIKQQELEKAINQLNSGAEPEKVLESTLRLLTNKLIHTPSANLKKISEQGNTKLIRDFADIFELDISGEQDDSGNTE